VIHAGLAVGGVEGHVAERLLGQRPVTERRHLHIELGADPAHLGLADPGVGAQGLDQVVDLPRRCAVQVGLHDHREQRPIHPPPALQQTRDERPSPQLRDPQLQIPRGRGDRLRPMPIAQGRPCIGPLVWAGAGHGGQLGLDQRLIDRRRCLPDPVFDIRSLQRLEHLKQGRLVQSHRVVCPSARTIAVVSLTITRWPSSTWSPTPSSPNSYTTSWDVTVVDSQTPCSDRCDGQASERFCTSRHPMSATCY
jgi:hypothetical protein